MQPSLPGLKSMMDSLPLLNETELEQLLIALENLKKPHDLKKAKITGLEGLGKEIWKSIDVDKYIRNQRDEWDDRKIR